MGVYDANGTPLTAAYDADGNSLNKAYDIDGNTIWSAEPITLKVMTYNVGGWYYGGGSNVPSSADAVYYALQRGMIADNDPDILILQEYWTQFSQSGRSALTMLQDLFPYVVTAKGNTTYQGKAICSKYPISDYALHTFQASGNPYISCTVTVQNIPITVYSVHTAYQPQATRLAEIAELIPILQAETRFISAGDYNALIQAPGSTSNQEYQNNPKEFIDAGFNSANYVINGFLVTYSDEPTGTWAGCLDNIYTSSNITISNPFVDDTKLHDNLTERCDHMPLIATVTI